MVRRTLLYPAIALVISLASAHAQRPARTEQSDVTRQFREALGLAQRGHESQALTNVNALLERHPEFAPGLKLQGELLEDMGRQSEAAESYQNALKLTPNDPELLLKVGIDDLLAEHYGESIALLRHRLKLVPRDRDALYYLAQAYHLNGDNTLAVTTIAECVKIDPSNASVLQKYGELLSSSGDNEGALEWLRKAQQIDPTLPRIDFDLGVASYYTMDFPNALNHSAKAAEQQPGSPEALALYAAAQSSLAQWQGAEKTFQQILALKPDDLTALLGLGRCEVELRNYQAAVDTLQRVLRIDPTRILAHFYLSRAYAGLGKTAEAQNEADLHSRMLAQQSAAPANEDREREEAVWKQARQLLTNHREEEARQLFEKSAVGPSASAGSGYVLVGALYVSMGDVVNARRNLNDALRVEPSVRGAYTYLGLLALQQGDISGAEREFESELSHHPNYLPAISEIGRVRYRQGRWEAAADNLEKSETRDPALLYMLCDSYFHLGRTRDAKITAETLAAYARSEPQVMRGLIDLLNRNGESALAQRLAANLKQ